MNNLNDTILQQIKSGQLDMKPRWHFALRSALWVSGLVLVALLSVYLISFVFFILRESGLLFTPGFGWRGISFAVLSSPWILIIVSAVFLGVLAILVKHFAFSYQRPLVYTLVGIVFLSLLGAWAIGQTVLHERLGGYAERNNLPVVAPLYRDATPPAGLTVGTITALSETGFTLELVSGDIVQVLVTPRTKQPRWAAFAVGDTVLVAGDRSNDTIEAYGVRPHAPERIERLKRLRGSDQVGQVLRPLRDGLPRPVQ